MSFADLNIVECLQGDKDWFECRVGMLTASRVKDAIAKSKRGGDLQCRTDLAMALAVERVTKKPTETFVSPWMQRGTELEPMARAAYELRTDTLAKQVGFILHPTIMWAGSNPDGLIGDSGLVEFKCPKPTTHAEYLINEVVPELYQPQILWQMACCPGYEWCDFVSYCPDFPEPLDLFICRMPRDDKRIAEMEAEARKFLEEVDATTIRLRHGLEGALEQSLQEVSQ